MKKITLEILVDEWEIHELFKNDSTKSDMKNVKQSIGQMLASDIEDMYKFHLSSDKVKATLLKEEDYTKKSINAIFEMEKETMYTFRFGEKVKIGEYPAIGTLYVHKDALGKIGFQEGNMLAVTLSTQEKDSLGKTFTFSSKVN